MDEDIILKYLQGKADAQECLEVETWAQDSPEHQKTLEQLYYTLFIADRADARDRIDTESALRKLKGEIKKKEKGSSSKRSFTRFYRMAGMAAAFLAGAVFAGGVAYGLLSDHFADYTISTSAGQRAQATLPDGSKVWLNASTSLVYKNSLWSTKREVDLSGEAYFEVAKNKYLPFIVSSKKINTRVLGTKFNVRARAEEHRVVTTLLQGSVQMESPIAPEGRILKPGQSMTIDTHTYQAELVEYSSPNDILTWIDGRLRFNRNTLSSITSLMEKLYDVKFVYEDSSLRNEQFTGDFSTDSTPDAILEVLSLTNHFGFYRKGDVIHLTKQ